jgi:hypothetical protein
VLAWSCVLAPKVLPLTLSLGGVGALLLGLVLVRGLHDLLGSAVLLLAACYLLGLFVGRHVLDEAAPLVAAALLACAELAAWSLDDRPHVPADRGLTAARARAVALLVLAGLGAAVLVLVVASASIGGGLLWTVLGAAAAVGVLAVIGRLAAGTR